MKSLDILLLSLAIAAGMGGPGWTHDPTAFVYYAPQVPPGVAIAVDGDLGDWSWFPEVLGITTDQAFVHGGPDIFNPKDFDWKIRVAWSDEENELYVACEIRDDIFFPYETPGERETYLYDNFELIVDADHSGGLYQGSGVAEEESGTQAQQWMFPLGGPTAGYHFIYLFGGATWYGQFPYSEYAYRYQGDNRHAGEISLIPFDFTSQEGAAQSRVHDLKADEILGLSCMYDDHDERGTAIDGQWKTHESADGAVDATVIAHFVLLPPPPDAAVVEPQTWARIKQALAER